VFLGERVGWRRWSAVLFGFAGVSLRYVRRPRWLTLPALIALAGSFFFALLMIGRACCAERPISCWGPGRSDDVSLRLVAATVRLDRAPAIDVA